MEPNDELLSAYLDDELSDAERTQVEQRLETDGAYRRRYEDYQVLREAVQKLPRHRLGDDFAKHIVDLIGTGQATLDQATPEQAANELSPGVSESTPRRLVGRIVPWAVASLAAGVVFMLLIPSLRERKSSLATRIPASNGEEVLPAESALTDEFGSGLVLSAPESAVDAENVSVDAAKVASDAYSAELFSEREAPPAPAFDDVLEEGKEEQILQKAAGTTSVEGLVEIDRLAEKTDESRGNRGLGEFDYVVTATSVGHKQLQTVLENQRIVSANAPINLRGSNESTSLYKSRSLALPYEQPSPTSSDTTAARSQAAAAPKAAPATAGGIAGRDVSGLARKSGERFRSKEDSLAGAVEQDTATQYVLVEASQQRIQAVLRELNQFGPQIESLPNESAGTAWQAPNVSTGEFWYQPVDEDAPAGKKLREPTANNIAPTQDAAAESRTPAIAPALVERDETFERNGTYKDSELDADAISRRDRQVRRQTKARFAAPSDEPAQQYFSVEALGRSLGRITGGSEDRVRVLFVVGTSQPSGEPEDSSPAQPARP